MGGSTSGNTPRIRSRTLDSYLTCCPEVRTSVLLFCNSLGTIPCSIGPIIPFAPNSKSVPEQTSNLLHQWDRCISWSYRRAHDFLLRFQHHRSERRNFKTRAEQQGHGQPHLPSQNPPIPVAIVNWHRTWDSSGNGEFSRSDMVSSDVYIEQVP